MGRAVLMVAFHFPPAAMGSGHLRTLGFARYLSEMGWDPVVMSARPLAYPRKALIAADTIPQGCVVQRALALDARRHFGIGGKYPGFLAQPDRWASWWPAAVVQGMRLIHRHRIRAIWSTYPIMSAHCIARTLSRTARLPWIADFRDPVSSSVEATNPYSVGSQQRWERRVLRDASKVVFTTPGAMEACANQYPEASAAGRLAVIGNGYDERSFADLPDAPWPATGDRPLTLIHSGILYPDGRNPEPFLTALSRLGQAGGVEAGRLRIILRASGSESNYARVVQRLGLDGVVELAPQVSNRDALMEQATADGLLLFQGDRFDRQIPAKLYEYLRIGRPIFGLVGAAGDTARVLRETGGAVLAPPDDVDAIADRMRDFIHALREGTIAVAPPEQVAKYSRREGAVDLAGLLREVCD